MLMQKEARRGRGQGYPVRHCALSPSAVTLNITLSLITTTITLRNKLVFFQRRIEMGKRRPSYASGLPFSLQHLSLFGNRHTTDQFSLQFSTLYNSFLFSVSLFLCLPPVLLPLSLNIVKTSERGWFRSHKLFTTQNYIKIVWLTAQLNTKFSWPCLFNFKLHESYIYSKFPF